jgi:hypothetical protein
VVESFLGITFSPTYGFFILESNHQFECISWHLPTPFEQILNISGKNDLMHTKNGKSVGKKQTLHPKQAQKVSDKMGEVSLLLKKDGQNNFHYPNPRNTMALRLQLGVDSRSSLLRLRQKVQPCVASMYQTSSMQNAMHIHLTLAWPIIYYVHCPLFGTNVPNF